MSAVFPAFAVARMPAVSLQPVVFPLSVTVLRSAELPVRCRDVPGSCAGDVSDVLSCAFVFGTSCSISSLLSSTFSCLLSFVPSSCVCSVVSSFVFSVFFSFFFCCFLESAFLLLLSSVCVCSFSYFSLEQYFLF